MKATIPITMAILAILVATAPTAAATKVFLLGGQSNMLGVGNANDIPAPYQAVQPQVRFWENGQWVSLQGGFGYTKYAYPCFGPEVSFGYALHNTIFPNDDIYLVKHGADGTNLAVAWKPDGTGPEYTAFKSKVDAAMQSLVQVNLSPEIAGMIWMQGEGDTYQHAAQYATNLTTFIRTVRSDFRTPDMPFVVGRITTVFPPNGPAENNALVRAAQESVPALVGHASWINTDDLERRSPDDPGHYGTRGQIDLGLRFAHQFITTPEPSSIVPAVSAALAFAIFVRRTAHGSRHCHRQVRHVFFEESGGG